MTFTVWDLFLLLVVAGACGAVGQALTGYSRGGVLASVALGFIGAMFGLWMARGLDLPEPLMLRIGGDSFPVVWSTVGAALFVALLSLITGPGHVRRR